MVLSQVPQHSIPMWHWDGQRCVERWKATPSKHKVAVLIEWCLLIMIWLLATRKGWHNWGCNFPSSFWAKMRTRNCIYSRQNTESTLWYHKRCRHANSSASKYNFFTVTEARKEWVVPDVIRICCWTEPSGHLEQNWAIEIGRMFLKISQAMPGYSTWVASQCLQINAQRRPAQTGNIKAVLNHLALMPWF